jgi:hypothetical protein
MPATANSRRPVPVTVPVYGACQLHCERTSNSRTSHTQMRGILHPYGNPRLRPEELVATLENGYARGLRLR